MQNISKLQKDKRLKEKMRREFGPEICRLLRTPDVTNILLNDDTQIWFEKTGQPMRCAGHIDPVQSAAAIKTIAAFYQEVMTEKTPIIEARLPLDDSSRFEGLLPPVVRYPVFAIRRHRTQLLTLEDFVEQNVMTAHAARLIKRSIKRLDNIIICGGTGSGKTTLLNSCLHYASTLYPQRRRVIIEDTPELKRLAPNCLMLHAQQGNPHADGLALLKATMRLYPASIDYSEVRDGAAHTLLKAWTTGHPGGFCSLHVSHGKSGILRLEQLLSESISRPMPHLIGEAVQLFINIQKSSNGLGRHLTALTALNGYQNGHYLTRQLPLSA